MIASSRRRLLSAATAVLVVGAVGFAAPAARAAVAVDARVPATCSATGSTGIPNVIGKSVAIDVKGTVPANEYYSGQPFTLDDLTLGITIDPDAFRLQAVLTDGTLSARIDQLSATTTGTTQPSSPIVSPDAPLDLGTIPNRLDLAPRFVAPPGAPKATFPPIGPWTVAQDAGAITLGLGKFGLTLTFVRPDQPTFAPVTTTLSCAPNSFAFAKFPVNGEPPARPAITGLAPSSGAGGSVVTISGSGFSEATEVSFEGIPATFKVASDTSIQAVVPTLYFVVAPPPTLAWDVSVTTAAGTSLDTAADDFTYLTGTPTPTPTPAPTPTPIPTPIPTGPKVLSLAPAQVSAVTGGLIHVRGAGLKGATGVLIGGASAPFLVINDRDVIAYASPRKVGKYPVVVRTRTGTSPITGRSLLTFR